MIHKLGNINKVPFMGNNPAMVNRLTGDIYINERIWNYLPEEIREFILLHEEGHYVLQTTDEYLADAYASHKFLGKKKNSLKSSIDALEKFLNNRTDSQSFLRVFNQYLRALKYDYVINGNKKAKQYYLLMYKNQKDNDN